MSDADSAWHGGLVPCAALIGCPRQTICSHFTTDDAGQMSLRTGDMGYPDHDGQLHLAGRSDDVVKVRGVTRFVPGANASVYESPFVASLAGTVAREPGMEPARFRPRLQPDARRFSGSHKSEYTDDSPDPSTSLRRRLGARPTDSP